MKGFTEEGQMSMIMNQIEVLFNNLTGIKESLGNEFSLVVLSLRTHKHN
jgi:hypothetical protein